MKKARALIYFIMGVLMCWSAIRQGSYLLAAGVAFFVLCAIGITLASIGQLEIIWDDIGITLRKKPRVPRFIKWSDLHKLTVDHLGYHVKTDKTSFRISRHNMPKELLQKIRTSIRENTQPIDR